MNYKNGPYSCPLCGHVFDEPIKACWRGKACRQTCCPRCRYSIFQESKTVQFLKGIFGRLRSR